MSQKLFGPSGEGEDRAKMRVLVVLMSEEHPNLLKYFSNSFASAGYWFSPTVPSLLKRWPEDDIDSSVGGAGDYGRALPQGRSR